MSMDLQVKEMRMVILGLRKLLESTQAELEKLPEGDDEYIFLSNDYVLMDSLIAAFEDEYQIKFESNQRKC
jgi:hypothetical protein